MNRFPRSLVFHRSAGSVFLTAVLASVVFHLHLPVVHAAGQSRMQNDAAANQDKAQFFEKKIRPVLAERCYECHSASTRSKGQLRLDDRAAPLQGGKSGPAIVPGDPEASLLWQRITSTDLTHRMPKDEEESLPQDQIDDLRAWIKSGAYWPGNDEALVRAKTVKQDVGTAQASDTDYFVQHVRPILENHCYACHAAATKPAGGLRVDTSLGIQTGGHSGSIIAPGDPSNSLLLKRVQEANAKTRMPRESGPLSGDEIATLTKWIQQGAKLPDETEALPPTSAALQRVYDQLKRDHWAFRPVAHPQIPQVDHKNWAKNNIDRFVLAALEEKKLEPVHDANPVVLIRRVTFDLTGLPATPDSVASFRRHHSEQDYEHLVDSLLNSRQYAERWARHWLDVARYGESTGPSRNIPYPHAWRYRDYVIDAMQRDVPFNRFIQEQIAGDLLPASTAAERDRLRIATGFLALGVKDVNQRFEARYQMDRVDDQIDTVSRSVLAMTTTCARCHDHKFDPVPTRDYYALAGIFTSTNDEVGLRSLMGGSGLAYYDPKHLLTTSDAVLHPPTAKLKRLDAEIAANRKAIEALQNSKPVLDEATKEEVAALSLIGESLREQRLDLSDAGTLGHGIHGVQEGTIADTAVRIRGTEERHGPMVARGYLTAFNVTDAPVVDPRQSGRLQLAAWLTSAQNPLTARVAVNRIWAHLFGQGIVTTVDNFGVKGDKPSNLALLDYLANDFIAQGWSQRKLIREIVLSHTYRLGSELPAQLKGADQANRLTARHSPRRLEAEEVRDAVLASAGSLDPTPSSGSPAMKLKMIEMTDNGEEAKYIYDQADQSNKRSIYLPLLRGITPRSLAAFDPVSQSLVTGQRDVTVVPTQALFLLNSSFIRQQSLYLAAQLEQRQMDTSAQVHQAYERILGRDPSRDEVVRASSFLRSYAQSWSNQPKQPTVATSPLVTEVEESKTKLTLDPADDVDQGGLTFNDPPLQPTSPQQAALSTFVQSLYASAEFQYLR